MNSMTRHVIFGTGAIGLATYHAPASDLNGDYPRFVRWAVTYRSLPFSNPT